MASSASKNLANQQAAALAAQIANMAAQLEFQKERMRLLELPQFAHLKQMDIDKLAFEKSQAEWQKALQEATQTGMYQGKPTLQWLEQQAKLFGVIDGQQTLEGKLTDAQVAQINHSMQLQSHAALLEDQKFGFERERWGAEFDYQMMKDLRDFGLSEAQITGMYNGQETLASKELNSKNTQAYLGLLANLQGPGNAFKQMRVLGNTPGGLTDMVKQWTGQYQIGGLTGSGQNPGQAQVSDLFDQSYGQAFMGAQPQGPVRGAPGVAMVPGQGAEGTPAGGFVRGSLPPAQPVSPVVRDGAAMPAEAGAAVVREDGSSPWVKGGAPTVGTLQVPAYTTDPVPGNPTLVATGAAGVQAPAGEQGFTVSPPGTQAPVGAYNYAGTPSGQTQVYPPGVPAPVDEAQVSMTTPSAMGTGLLPNQINAENYKNSNKYAQEFMWGYLENQGWDKMAAQDAFQKSLPKYGGPTAGVVNAGLGM